MSKNSDDVRPPAIPSIRLDGTVDANGLRLGKLDMWEPNEDAIEGSSADHYGVADTDEHEDDCDCPACR